jgi:CHASE2 domain-containing sensor protein
MNLPRTLLRRIDSLSRHASTAIARRLRTNFYLYLAAAFSLFIVIDALGLRAIVDMRQRSYDMVIRYRIIVPKPDPDIVIVDINEASLAAMAKEYGRWPWPRQVLGEFVEKLEEQAPKAVVFDILFSDPDVFNPDSDASFNEVIAGTSNTFFPMLRLPPESDRLSQVNPAVIPGVERIEGASDAAGTVAVILPHFEAALASARLGTNNIYPDADGVARRYRLWHDVHGWRLSSLPLKVAQALGSKEAPPTTDMLINWRGSPFTYRYLSFGDVFLDMQKKERIRPRDEFRGKIVLIGSTAPSLFDIKATSMAREFPGVEILATAIDNLTHRDWIRTPKTSLTNALVALLIVWAMGVALYRNPDSDRFNRLFGLSQIALLAFSYATINLTSYFLNLTGPVFLGLIYFSIARVYSFATARALEKSAVARTLASSEGSGATLLLVQLRGAEGVVSGAFLKRLRKELLAVGIEPKDVEMIKGRQRGIWGLFDATVGISWAYPPSDESRRARVEADMQAVRERLPELVARLRVNDEEVAAASVAHAALGGGTEAEVRARWRHLFAEALANANERQG